MDLKKCFYSGSKKLELNKETLTSGDNPKNMHDVTLDDPKNLDDVFTEGLSSPDCAKILYSCIKNL